SIGAAAGLAPGSAAISTSRALTDILTACQHAGTFRRPCPECDRGPKDRALAVSIKPDGQAVYFCHRCHLRGAVRGDHQRCAAPVAAPPGQQYESLSDKGRELWRSCQPIAGEARAYLEARCCVLPPTDGHLRWRSRLRHPCWHVGPALVALVTDAISGMPMTLHRTWITSTGKKAALDLPRLLLGKQRKAGGVIRLWPGDAVAHGLAVAEGIETALAGVHGFTPVWSCIDADNLSNLPLLKAIDALTIFADHDDAGLSSAATLARRWADAGRHVVIATPATEGFDMADEVRCE